MKNNRLILICVLILGLSQPGKASAAENNTALILTAIVGGVVVVVEGINLLIHAVGRNRPPKVKTPDVIPPDVRPMTNAMIAMVTNTAPQTNSQMFQDIVPFTNIMATNVIASVTNTATVVSNMVSYATNVVEAVTNRLSVADTNLTALSQDVRTNLSAAERQDIMLFGRDHYYQVALAYNAVGKHEKAREFMFHTLAIGVRVEEATVFLRKNFSLSDMEIRNGRSKYLHSHE